MSLNKIELGFRSLTVENRLCADIIRSFVQLDETQPRNIEAWRPVVVDVMEGYTNFSRDDFEKHIETFYPLAVELLNRELGPEVRLALQSLLRRIGEIRIGMAPFRTTLQTPTSPHSISSNYFSKRVGRGR
jgi:brefeldin A-inhibited guanine nucleotide-exchange protein